MDLPKQVVRLLVKRVNGLAANPRPAGVEKLSGIDRYRIRQGDYRMVYAIDDEQKVVDIVRIAHRKDVYR